MNQTELIKLMDQWQQTTPNIYKSNIKVICDFKGIKTRHIVEALSITRSKAVSLINPLHSGRIEFYDALRLAELLNVKVEKFLEEN